MRTWCASVTVPGTRETLCALHLITQCWAVILRLQTQLGECCGRAEVEMGMICTHTPDVVSRKKWSVAHPAASEQGEGRRQWGLGSSHAHRSFTTWSLQAVKSLVLSRCCNEQRPALEKPHGYQPGDLQNKVVLQKGVAESGLK